MAADENLTGVWEGLYSYPRLYPPNPFTAVLIDSGGSLSGSVHEVSLSGRTKGETLTAMIAGGCNGRHVHFSKTYDPSPRPRQRLIYDGELNAEATEIEGVWKIAGAWSGRFLMIRSRRPAEAVAAKKEIAVPVE